MTKSRQQINLLLVYYFFKFYNGSTPWLIWSTWSWIQKLPFMDSFICFEKLKNRPALRRWRIANVVKTKRCFGLRIWTINDVHRHENIAKQSYKRMSNWKVFIHSRLHSRLIFRQFTNLTIFRSVFQHCLRSTLFLFYCLIYI